MSWARELAYHLRRSFLFNLPIVAAAAIWRRLLFRTTFIAVTGSRGKTTTKDLLGALLATRSPTIKTVANHNGRDGIPRTILRARPWHRFVVIEVGIDRPGVMWRAALLTRPDIVVVTSVAAEHMENFPSLEVTAAEKAKLLRGLGKSGIAVLNGDDERVRRMADSGRFRAYLFGSSPDCDLWADAIEGHWPERMRLRAHSGGETFEVATRLVGTQWAAPVLAALLTARACGVDLVAAVPEVTRLQPNTARMQPVRLASGAVMIRDEHNGSAGTTETALRELGQARARRRIAILRDVTDDARPAEIRLAALGSDAARVADVVIFVGPDNGHGVRGALEAGLNPQRALGFERLQDVVSWLKQHLREGDLVLLKGGHFDHISRIYFGLLGPVDCWKERCRRGGLCDNCPELGPQSRPLEYD